MKTCPCNLQKMFGGKNDKNEYPQSLFWSKNKKNRYIPAYPSFDLLKWGSRVYTLHGHVFLMLSCVLDGIEHQSCCMGLENMMKVWIYGKYRL